MTNRHDSPIPMHSAFNHDLSVHGSGGPVILVSGMDGTGKLFYRQVPFARRTGVRSRYVTGYSGR